ncbi:MAG: hypothetical protein K0R93_3689 [Anaerosolibacter sp.]|jgi:hypothetical protein|uniref:hypothetical protein n=1 Tax=Anaerosolibacter sp. TaxID=1872527 RepID=UPI00262B3797|nr:hypothetical protein [Anaerosolibacter sp.]MDF2548791.1 hypothetical protein [Anaerosolibacter sp.]
MKEAAIFYIGLAITGTNQEYKTKIDFNKLQNYLRKYARIAAKGETPEEFLKREDLGTLVQIKEAVKEYQRRQDMCHISLVLEDYWSKQVMSR